MVKIGTNQYLQLLHSSQRSNKTQMTALRHMATGLRVESGRDDPGNLIAAATLRSEKQALQTANEVSGRAAGLVAVADDALDSMGNAIRRLRTIQLEADNNYISVDERNALQDEADDLIRHIDELSKDTEYNGIKVFQEPVTGDPFHPDNIGEVGATQIVQPDGAAWNTQSLSEEYDDPIVIAGPIGSVGGQSAHIRLRNVESDQFQFQTEEWEYLDGFHLTETFFWMVHEEGVHELSDGTVIEAGRVMVDGSATTVGLNASFTGTPLVFATVVTNNDNTAVNARVSGVSAGGFTLDLQEQELFEKGTSADAAHGLEEVNYVAITSPTGPTGSGNTAVVDPTKGVNYQTGIQTGVTNSLSTVNFSAVGNPLFIGQPQTLNETDTINLRHTNLTGSSIQIRNQEEQSLDGETG
ncbi:MAG: flagellin, partial [Planctomycetota bacterium]